MTLRQSAQKVVDTWLGDCVGATDEQALNEAIEAMRTQLRNRKPLTDDEISVLWHQANNQPFKFARMLQEVLG